MIRALTSDRSNDALGVRVLPRGTWCRPHLLDAHTLGCGSDGRERTVPIVEEILRGLIVGERLAELLGGPGSRGIRGHRDVHDAPPMVRQDDQHKQKSIRDSRDDEEVGGHQLGGVIREKRAPGLGGWALTPHHVLRDSRLTP